MPTEQEFEDFKKSIPEFDANFSVSYGLLLDTRFPAKEDRYAYLKWARERARQRRQQMATTPPTRRNELSNLIDTLNYNDKLQRAQLVGSIHRNVVPWFHAGTDAQGDIYRIVPQPYALIADQPLPKTDREIVSPNVLGVNLNVQPVKPSHRRVANYSEQSTKSNESDDTEATGFVFHQIGVLECVFSDEDEVTAQSVAEGPWFPTDFGVVMKINRNGAPGGIYIIYDFYPTNQETGQRLSERPDIPDWGCLGDIPGRIVVAKIASTMSELVFGRKFEPTVIADYPVELVRVVLGWGNTLQRVTVMEESRE
ncbi:hypothetical protein FQN54_004398 [Arachnomyces sp. PD_36]|nr:hypothetical protein FQN54_004398 [Arachnomyces sp. PD_36]